MKTTKGPDITRRSIFRWLAATCLATFLPGAVAWAGVDPQPFRTGLFGVTGGQTIRISIVNAGAARGIIEPCFRVWDAAGTLLFETDGGPLPGGVGTFVDFNAPATGAGFRTQLRAEVELVPAVRPADPEAWLATLRQGLLLSLEVFDTATGQTVFTTPFATVAGVEPTPFAPVAGIEPVPFRTGLLGVTAGQAIRVSVLNAGDVGGVINPCFRIWDAAGTLLAGKETGPLPGGTGTFVDFTPAPPPSGTPTRSTRVQVRAEVELLPAVFPPDPVAARVRRRPEVHLNLEVFDTATGQTVYTMPFATIGFNPQPEPPRR
jgi:hypothetical protein